MHKSIYSLYAFLALGSLVYGVDHFDNVGTKNQTYKTSQEKQDVFKKLGCTYFNDMKIDAGCAQKADQTEYYQQNEVLIKKLSEKYRADVIKRKLAPMYLKFISPKIGYGIFALRDIKKGDFIGVYTGTLRRVDWNNTSFQEDVDYAWYYTVDDANYNKMIIDGKYKGNELRFINHAANPNTSRIDVVVNNVFYVCYIATRDIPKNTELTVSYGEGYWMTRGVTPESIA